MKTILCFGDSNTWGYDAASGGRFPPEVRWPGVVRRELGAPFHVIEEGLNSRTTVWDDPIDGEGKNGRVYLMPCLDSHAPLDLVVILLGTNDLKKRFSLSAYDIAGGAEVLVKTVLASTAGPGGAAPRLLLLAPPPVGRLSDFAEMFEGAEAKSRRLGARYRQIAELHGCKFLDTAEVIVSWDLDGIHFAPEEHGKLGRAVAAAVRRILA
jgi:lysophospholipase L1-like esterase